MTFSTFLFRSSSNANFEIWAVIGLGAGLYLFFRGFQLLQRRRLILDTPSSKIRSASMGMVEISGLAVGPYTMAAPITNRDCYYYRTVVWEWEQRGRSSQWVKVATECMHLAFFIDDNTGRLLVDPRGAELDLHCDFKEEFCDSFFTLKEEAPGNVRNFLARHGIETGNKIKVEEFCIKPKNALFVLGTLAENTQLRVRQEPVQDFESEPSAVERVIPFAFRRNAFSLSADGNGSLEVAVPAPRLDPASQLSATHVVQLSTGDAPTKAADMTQQQKIAAAMMKAGIANPAAWAVTGQATQARAGSAVMDASRQNPTSSDGGADGFEAHPPVVLMKGANNKTFLISWHSRQDVTRSLGWQCTLMIWGGPALALLCLYALLNLTHTL